MHTRAPAPERADRVPGPRTIRTARIWNLALLLNGLAALTIQIALVLTGGPDPNTGETVASVGVATRMVQTVSFFTVQSNLLGYPAALRAMAGVLAVSLLLVGAFVGIDRARGRRGRDDRGRIGPAPP